MLNKQKLIEYYEHCQEAERLKKIRERKERQLREENERNKKKLEREQKIKQKEIEDKSQRNILDMKNISLIRDSNMPGSDRGDKDTPSFVVVDNNPGFSKQSKAQDASSINFPPKNQFGIPMSEGIENDDQDEEY